MVKHALHSLLKTGYCLHGCLRVLLDSCEYARHRVSLFLVDFEEVVGYCVLWFGPKNSIAFNVQLQLEFSILSCGNILCYILQDHKINKFANKLSIMHIFSVVLLRIIQYLMVDYTCSHMKGWLEHLNISRNSNDLVQ